jgi:hypothetical protein
MKQNKNSTGVKTMSQIELSENQINEIAERIASILSKRINIPKSTQVMSIKEALINSFAKIFEDFFKAREAAGFGNTGMYFQVLPTKHG